MTGFTDIPQSRLKARLPGWIQACIELARLDRPVGSWLLLFPCFWGLAAAGEARPFIYLVFAAGAFVMRGAGCTINDIIDRRIDGQVERTRGRPLPSGRIGLGGAFLFLGLLLGLGLLVLMQLNRTCLLLGCASLLLVVTYPFMKRVTWWPQLFLGFTFNWGALMGWAQATGGEVGLPAVLLYVGGIVWTLGYDTIYAHQDKADDNRIGVKSTARRLGAASRQSIAAFYAVALLIVCIAGWLTGTGWGFYVVMLGVAAYSTWLVMRWNPDSPADCLARFKANPWIGLAIFAAIVIGRRCG